MSNHINNKNDGPIQMIDRSDLFLINSDNNNEKDPSIPIV